MMEESAWEAFDLARLVEKCDARGTPYLEFLRVPQLSCGIYALAAGAKDTQSTHDEDEVYVVLKGRAELVVDGEEITLCEGSIVYVPADVPHEFVRIEEDLSLLVFFGSGGPSGAEV
jgi:mannose-6-phosphate isomerase-like protein (cupin superfamily)